MTIRAYRRRHGLTSVIDRLEPRRLLAALADFGDAPDTYGTTLATNGAWHDIDPGMHLGQLIDPEPDGQPSTLANWDDIYGVDDDDGVHFATPFSQGGIARVDVFNGGGPAHLNAWIDFDGNGQFDPMEHVIVNFPMQAGSLNPFLIPVPFNAMPGPTYARFRINEGGGIGPRDHGGFGEVEDYRIHIHDFFTGGPSDVRHDFGDNPDSYRTRFANNGPHHRVAPALRFGPHIDVEVDGNPSPAADGDDLAGFDDEDGIHFLALPTVGGTGSIQMTNGGTIPGRVDAWIDFNRNGTFADADDQILSSFLLAPGTTTFTFPVPAGAVAGTTYSRFRISLNGGLTYFGYGFEGEVEDHLLHILPGETASLDFGDAPDTYATFLASNGARHTPANELKLGPLVDAEPDGAPSPAADGDDLAGVDDEDGIKLLDPIRPGATVRVEVIHGGTLPGRLDAWIDFLGNGQFTDPFDQIFTSALILPGTSIFSFIVPTFANVGQTYARFRLSANGGLTPAGFGDRGEVEDYLVRIDPNDTRQHLDFGDAPESAGGLFNYPTTLGGPAGNPARHVIAPNGPRLGLVLVDAEVDGQPNLAADGDDLNGIDDEDGISVAGTPLNLVTFTAGTVVTLDVVNGGIPGRLNAWFDWNQNGTWEPSEQVAVDFPLASGTNALSITVPATLTAGTMVYSRFRLSTLGGLTPQGLAPDGEVEDYRTAIAVDPTVPLFDFGDAPSRTQFGTSFQTLLSENGARHGLVHGMPILGRLWDADPDGNPTADALGDDHLATDDEDGVFDAAGNRIELTPLVAGRLNRIVVEVGGGLPGYLNGWIDLNLDGDWNDPGEHFIADHFTSGMNTYGVFLPSGLSGGTMLRFRVSSAPGLDHFGPAADGEVEDYHVKIVPDTTGPTVVGARFEWNWRQALTLFFDEPIDPASLDAGDLIVENLDDGNVYTPVLASPGAGNDVATFVFNTPGQYLSNGNYRLLLPANAVVDPSGNGNAAHVVTGTTIYYLAGDADRDRAVDFDDLLILAQNYNTAGHGFAGGNFDYSAGGGVDFDDLLILAQNYNTTLFSALPIRVTETEKRRRPSLSLASVL